MNKRTSYGLLLVAIAVLSSCALALTARRIYLLADVRVLSVEMIAQESLQPYPLTSEQEKYKNLRDHREVEVAKAESAQWRRLGRVLVYAQAFPIGVLGLAVWLIAGRKHE